MALNEKDMSKLQDLKRFGQVIKDKFGILRNYKGGSARMSWGHNDAMSVDQVFQLEIPYTCKHCEERQTVHIYLDWQEVMHYGRAVSDWKFAYEQIKAEAERRMGK